MLTTYDYGSTCVTGANLMQQIKVDKEILMRGRSWHFSRQPQYQLPAAICRFTPTSPRKTS